MVVPGGMLVSYEGGTPVRMVLFTVPRISRSRKRFPDGFDLYVLRACDRRQRPGLGIAQSSYQESARVVCDSSEESDSLALKGEPVAFCGEHTRDRPASAHRRTAGIATGGTSRFLKSTPPEMDRNRGPPGL